MKKLLLIGFLFIAALTTFAQRTESYTNMLIQTGYVYCLIKNIQIYDNGTIGYTNYDYTYSHSSDPSIIKIGQSATYFTGYRVESQCCGFIVYDLAEELGGINPNATSATLRVELYNSAGQPPTLIYGIKELSNSIVNLTTQQQWQTIAPSSSDASQYYNQELVYNITSLINSNSQSGKIVIGFRANSVDQMYDAIQYSRITFTGTATVQEQISVTVKNNFNGGVIKARVDTPPTTNSNSPVTITDMTSKTLYMEAVEGGSQPVFENYARVWNDTEGSNNKSAWEKWNNNNQFITDISSNMNTNLTLSSSENNYSYVADMKKLCNVTLVSSSGSVTANGSNYSSPAVVPVVEQNNITASSSNYSSNGVSYTFQNWKKDGTNYNSPITITAHGTYNAVFKAVPNYTAMNPTYGGNIGSPIVLSWTDHPDQHVTTYEIRRKVKHNGVFGNEEVIATVGRGVQTYTDYEYIRTSSYVDLINYEIRGFYVPDSPYIIGGYTAPYILSVYGEMGLAKKNESELTAAVAKELPKEYAINNHPNPFNPTTTISYQLPEAGLVTIKVYDILGKEVAELVNENKQAGYYSVNFDAGRLTSGIYISTIQSGNFIQSKKMLLIK